MVAGPCFAAWINASQAAVKRAPFDHCDVANVTPDLAACRCFSTTSPTALWLQTVTLRQVATGRGRFRSAVNFLPQATTASSMAMAGTRWSERVHRPFCGQGVVVDDGGLGPAVGTAPFVDRAARVRGPANSGGVENTDGARVALPKLSAPRCSNSVSALGLRATEASRQSLSGILVETGVRKLCTRPVYHLVSVLKLRWPTLTLLSIAMGKIGHTTRFP